MVKRGAEGCLLATAREIVSAPAYPVTVVDATGAGDSVAGAVIYGWLKRLPLADAGEAGQRNRRGESAEARDRT